jgi:hypothetical protein
MDGFSDTGMRLTVNIVRGTVLVNGVPPSSLPRSITELPLFQRVFGADRNFAVVPALNGAGIRTSAPFKGADYTFVECEGHLVVREEQQCSHCGTMTTLVLVSPTAQGQQRLWSCGTQLPNRLMKMHSHWYCAELRLVLFGPTAEPHAARSPTVRHLLASGVIEQRLQLAALYAATSSLLPDTRCGMTGAEYAVELLERCWTNRPLRQRESELLHNIAEFAEHMPALTVQCAHLRTSRPSHGSCSRRIQRAQTLRLSTSGSSCGAPRTGTPGQRWNCCNRSNCPAMLATCCRSWE